VPCTASPAAGPKVRVRSPKAAGLFGEPEHETLELSKRAKKLACSFEGFSLHAGTRVTAGARFALERLRYIVRPPLAIERLTRLPDGRLAYS